MHSYHLEVCSPTVNNVIKIKKNGVSGIFSTTEQMRSVKLTSPWLIFFMYQEFYLTELISSPRPYRVKKLARLTEPFSDITCTSQLKSTLN